MIFVENIIAFLFQIYKHKKKLLLGNEQILFLLFPWYVPVPKHH